MKKIYPSGFQKIRVSAEVFMFAILKCAETDDGRKERRSPWPPAMSEDVWAGRVKLRIAMKEEMRPYKQVEHGIRLRGIVLTQERTRVMFMVEVYCCATDVTRPTFFPHNMRSPANDTNSYSSGLPTHVLCPTKCWRKPALSVR